MALSVNPEAPVVVNLTVPVGCTRSLPGRWPDGRFLFSPEFLREGHALHENLHPLRIVVGVPSESAHAEELEAAPREYASLLAAGVEDGGVPTRIVRAAEVVKLFVDTHLALRVAYFSELDTYAEPRGLDAGQVVECVGLGPRIGSHYNNPSFGYGGHCLPKDAKQLLTNYGHVPQDLVGAIVGANRTRKEVVSEKLV